MGNKQVCGENVFQVRLQYFELMKHFSEVMLQFLKLKVIWISETHLSFIPHMIEQTNSYTDLITIYFK